MKIPNLFFKFEKFEKLRPKHRFLCNSRVYLKKNFIRNSLGVFFSADSAVYEKKFNYISNIKGPKVLIFDQR